ncbi:MAG: hypothetical protein PHY34_06250 [Patescibacteria group bacterium]|nr:hypothetical protein [Patescibacteria group bacterium]MDD5715731.1 hypothetical protein [Patescibacteria group bacterium]
MYATTHVLAGIVISQHTPNIWWAFFLSLLSHYALDFIPHGDRPVERWIKRGPHLARSITVLSIDFALLMVILATTYHQLKLPAPSVLTAALIGSLLPDFLWIVYDLYVRHMKKHRLFSPLFKRWYTRILITYIEPTLNHHKRIHSYIDSVLNTHHFPALIGTIIQITFAGVFALLAVYFW